MPPAMLMRRWFYKNYHWTPDVVDRMPLEELNWLPIIETAEGEAADYKFRQQQKSMQHQTSTKPQRPIQGF